MKIKQNGNEKLHVAWYILRAYHVGAFDIIFKHSGIFSHKHPLSVCFVMDSILGREEKMFSVFRVESVVRRFN